jgi:hypothetical protein
VASLDSGIEKGFPALSAFEFVRRSLIRAAAKPSATKNTCQQLGAATLSIQYAKYVYIYRMLPYAHELLPIETLIKADLHRCLETMVLDVLYQVRHGAHQWPIAQNTGTICKKGTSVSERRSVQIVETIHDMVLRRFKSYASNNSRNQGHFTRLKFPI